MRETIEAARFLLIGPAILLMLFVIDLMTSPGDWWVQWPALGIGIAWFISLFRLVWALILAGGFAAVVAYFSTKR